MRSGARRWRQGAVRPWRPGVMRCGGALVGAVLHGRLADHRVVTRRAAATVMDGGARGLLLHCSACRIANNNKTRASESIERHARRPPRARAPQQQCKPPATVKFNAMAP